MRPILTADDTWAMGALDRRERLLVESVRVWVGRHLQGKGGVPEMVRVLKPLELCAVAAPLDAILRSTCHAATRCVDVRCRECCTLSPDEARLLHSVSSLQRGASEVAFDLLASWLHPLAARAILRRAEEVARVLDATMHRLPLRAWRFPELDGRSSWTVHTLRIQ